MINENLPISQGSTHQNTQDVFEDFPIIHHVCADGHTLWARGDVSLVETQTAAIVGVRAATSYGIALAAELAECITHARGTVITTGAYGIPTAALKATLAHGGRPIVVMPGGLDSIYPSANTELFGEVLTSGGLLISAKPAGVRPSRTAFLERNDLLVALSGMVAVIEASPRSGSMDIARKARAAGIPLGAVPGPVTSTTSHGCHDLLREGAHILANGSDLVELASHMTAPTRARHTA